jgi:hypothetical protein
MERRKLAPGRRVDGSRARGKPDLVVAARALSPTTPASDPDDARRDDDDDPRASAMAMLGSPMQFIASVPLVTRIWTATTLTLSLVYFYVQWTSFSGYTMPYLTLIPGESYIFPWTLFTSALVETSVIEVCAP